MSYFDFILGRVVDDDDEQLKKSGAITSALPTLPPPRTKTADEGLIEDLIRSRRAYSRPAPALVPEPPPLIPEPIVSAPVSRVSAYTPPPKAVRAPDEGYYDPLMGMEAPTPALTPISLHKDIANAGKQLGRKVDIVADAFIDKATFGLGPKLAGKGIDIVANALGAKPTGEGLNLEPQTDFEKALQFGGGLAGGLYTGGALLKGGKTVFKGGKAAIDKGIDLWKATPTAVKIPTAIGAGATAFETGRGALDPGYAERRETLPSELGASLRAGTGDVIGTAGNVLKWKGIDNAGQVMVDTGEGLKDGFELTPEEFSWKSFFNPDFYAKNVARSVPFMAALVPLMYAGFKVGKGGAAKAGLGEAGKLIAGSITGSALSRPVESALEAGGVFEEALAKGMSPAEADAAAQQVFERNLSLAGLDAAQLGMAFIPGAEKFNKLGKALAIGGKLGIETFTEAVEEGIQAGIQQQALGKDERSLVQQIINPTQETKEAMAIGGLFGAGLGGVGAVNDLAANKKASRPTPSSTEDQTKQVWQDINDAYSNSIKGEAPEAGALPELTLGEVEPAQADAEPEPLPESAGTYGQSRPGITRGTGRFNVSRPGTEQGEPAPAEPKTVYHPKTGEPLQVIDDSDPAVYTVANANGTTFKIGRRAVLTELPTQEAGAVPDQDAQPVTPVQDDSQRPPNDSTGSALPQRIAVTDKGVRDNSQRAVIENGVITVINHSGRKVIGKYSFDVSEWEAAENGPSANPNWNKRKIVEGKFKETFPDNYRDILQEPFNSRLIDSEISAINKAYGQYRLAGGSKPTIPTQAAGTPPVQGTTPDPSFIRKQVVPRGNKGPVNVFFPDQNHADLFRFAKVKGKRPKDDVIMIERLRSRHEIPEGTDVGEVADKYLQNVTNSIGSLKKGSDFNAPSLAEVLGGQEAGAKTVPRAPIPSKGTLHRGGTTTAKTESGTKVDVQYQVVDAGELIASHDTNLNVNANYPAELQPRDRTRSASKGQISGIVSQLEPEFLGDSPKASEGAPIIGDDMVVESGNARVIALKTVYDSNHANAGKYKAWLIDNAERFGLNPEEIKGMAQPVLVRGRMSDVDRVKFAQEANESSVATMSATEQAKADSSRLTVEALDLFIPSESGEIATRANDNFIVAFMRDIVGGNERGNYIASDGRISQAGVTRIKNAIFAAAYDDISVIEKLAESTDNNVKNITNAMLAAAPKLARIKKRISNGELHSLDISKEITEAANKLSHLRESGNTVEAYLKQTSLFDADISPLAKDILQVFNENKRSTKKLTAILQSYADGIVAAGDPRQESLFGKFTPTKEEVLLAAIRSVEKNGDAQTMIFQDEALGSSEVGKVDEGNAGTGKSGQNGPAGQAQAGVAAKKGKEPPAPQKTTKADEAKTSDNDTVQESRGGASDWSEDVNRQPPADGNDLNTVRRRDIIRDLAKALAPIRVGRFRQKALGIFKVWPEVIRTKYANDLSVVSHEVGHYLDKMFGLADPKLDSELQALGAATSRPSYSRAKVRAEGVAEFVRLYLTDPSEAKTQAPKFFADFEQTLDNNLDVKDVILTAQSDIRAWYSQPAKARVLGSISTDGKTARKMSLSSLYTITVDELHPLKEFVEKVGGDIPLEKNPFKLAWLARGWSGKAQVLLQRGVLDKNGKKKGKSLKEVLKPVENELDDFRAFIVAKHSLEVAAQDKLTGIYEADAQAVIDDAPSSYDGVLKDLVEYQDHLMSLLVDAGIMKQESLDTMRKMYPNYVPFHRVFEEDAGKVAAWLSKGGFANLRNPVMSMKGSTRDIIDPLESIVKNTFLFTNIAEKNKVGRAIAELAEDVEGIGYLVEKVAGRNSAKDNVLTIYKDGKELHYQLDPDLYQATLALDSESTNLIVQILSMPASWLRAGAVLSPDFVVRNPMRDMFTAFVNSNYGFIPVIDNLRGIFHAIKKDEVFWQYFNSGAAQATLVSLDRDYLQKGIRDLIKQKVTIKSAAKGIPKAPSYVLEVLRSLSELSEHSTRIGVFEKAIKAGADPLEAALESRDITLDFGRYGTKTKSVNKMVAFWNACIQGMDKIRRQFIQKPVQTSLRCLIGITLPSVILFMMNKDDDRYKELPRWQKDLFWIILTEDSIIRIPKPFELGVLFGTVPERALEWAYEKDPKAFEGLGDTIFEAAAPGVMPTAFLPWIEVITNYSFFTARPIVPMSEQGLRPSEQYNSYNTELAIGIGKAINVSPRKIESIIRGYTGGLGMYAAQLADYPIKAAGMGTEVPDPQKTMYDIPGLKGITVKPYSSAKSVDDFYNRLEELEIDSKTAKKTGEKFSDKKKADLTRLRAAKSAMDDVLKEERKIRESKTMTPEAKRRRLDIANMRKLNIARRALGKSNVN